jgi:hypothetical protein
VTTSEEDPQEGGLEPAGAPWEDNWEEDPQEGWAAFIVVPWRMLPANPAWVSGFVTIGKVLIQIMVALGILILMGIGLVFQETRVAVLTAVTAGFGGMVTYVGFTRLAR